MSTDHVALPLAEWSNRALADLLPGAPPARLDRVPPLWHWVHLLDHPAQADLASDGHPARGSVQAPPREGLRRMWAGGRVTCLAPLHTGEEAERRSHVTGEKHKEGRSGHLLIRTITHEIRQRGVVCVREEQDVVYLDPATGQSPAPPAAEPTSTVPTRPDGAADSSGTWTVDLTPTMLFQFSALTYNAHRIHYDKPYAQQVEGHAGLLVHGPLQALLMADLVRCTFGTEDERVRFEYRLLAPLFDHQGCVVHASRPESDGALVHTTVTDTSGRVTARGTFAPTGSS